MLSRRYGAGSGDLDTPVEDHTDAGTEPLSPGTVPEGPVSEAPGPRIPTDRIREPSPPSPKISASERILDALNVGVVVFDTEQNLRYTNAEQARLLGIDLARCGSMEDWLRAGCRDAAYAEEVVRSWREHLWQKQLTRVFSLKSASDQLREIEFRPRLLQNGDLLLTLLDVTDSRHAKDALRIAETKFDAVFQGVDSGIALVDRTGRFLDVNPAFESLLRYSRAELRRMALNDCIAFSDIERVRAAEVALADATIDPSTPPEAGLPLDPSLLHQREFTGPEAIRFRPREGEIFPAAVTLSLVLGPQGQPLFTLIAVHNEAEAGRIYEQSQARNRALLEAIPDLILVLDRDGKVRDLIPPNGGGWRGEMPTSAWVGQTISTCWPTFNEASVDRVRETIEEGTIHSWRLTGAPGELPAQQSARAAATGDDTAVVVVMDASDEAEAREVIARQSIAFRHLEEGIILTNLRGRIEDWNEAAEKSFGYRLEEVAGEAISRLYAPPGKTEVLNQEISRALTSEGRWQACRSYHRKDGSTDRAEVWILPVEESGIPRSLLAIHRPVPARPSLDAEADERHQHRWRNQLQTIGSLLNLEQDTATRGKSRAGTPEFLLKVQGRLKAASRLHDITTSVKNPVPLVDYIQALAEDLRRLVHGSESTRSPDPDMLFSVLPAGQSTSLDQSDPVPVEFETAFAFGLLFVELALPTLRRRTELRTPVAIGGKMVIGLYGGHPMMRARVPSAAMSELSLPVLKLLTEQLRGNLQVKHRDGQAGWTLRFPART